MKKKKKGFTIIEVIIAMLIFSIAATSISFVITTSSTMFKQDNEKYQTISAANCILEQLQAKGIQNTNTAVTSGQFNSIEGGFFNQSTATDAYEYIFFNYNDLTSAPEDINNYISVDPSYNSFTSCKQYNYVNKLNKTFGAFIHINRSDGVQINSSGNYDYNWYYNNYNITVEVWKLDSSFSDGSVSVTSTNISR